MVLTNCGSAEHERWVLAFLVSFGCSPKSRGFRQKHSGLPEYAKDNILWLLFQGKILKEETS